MKDVLFEAEEEDLEAFCAFEFYLGLGSRRTLTAVAKKMHMEIALVQKWARKFNWPGRISDREVLIREKISQSNDETLLQAALKYRARLSVLLHDYMQRIDLGTAHIDSIPDFLRVLKADQELLGIVTPAIEGGGVDQMSEEDLRKEIQKRQEKRSPQDERIIEKFLGFDPGGPPDISEARERARREAREKQAQPLHSFADDMASSSVLPEDDKPQWRQQRKQDDDGDSGLPVSLYRPIPDMVSTGEKEKAAQSG